VQLLLLANTMLEEIPDLEALCSKHPELYRTVGLHPGNCSEANTVLLSTILPQAISGDKVVGVGEIGLDYHGIQEGSPSAQILQREAFQIQLDIAQSAHLPVCVHTREAEEDTLSLLSSFPGIRGVIHCFTGGLPFARAVLDLGLFISFSGIVTFPNATTLQEVARFVPEDRLLIETDAPFLAPVPHRGKTNEPAWVACVAQHLAHLRGKDVDWVARQTTENFFSLFPLVSRG
jgi:TatD DNase family protein